MRSWEIREIILKGLREQRAGLLSSRADPPKFRAQRARMNAERMRARRQGAFAYRPDVYLGRKLTNAESHAFGSELRRMASDGIIELIFGARRITHVRLLHVVTDAAAT